MLSELPPQWMSAPEELVQTTGMQREALKILYDYGEQCVKDISHKLGKVHPQVSYELNVLKRRGIVTSERRGKKAYYRIRDKYREALHALFSLPDDVRSEVIEVANLLAEAEKVSTELFRRSLPPNLPNKQKADAIRIYKKRFRERVKEEAARVWQEVINDIKSGRLKTETPKS